jgi:hypothetical protein
LLIHEGRSVPYVAAMAGHSPRVRLERYPASSPRLSSAPACRWSTRSPRRALRSVCDQSATCGSCVRAPERRKPRRCRAFR